MKNGTPNRWLTFVLAAIFGGVFTWAGVVKALDPATFLVSVRSFQILPDPYAAWVALVLPWLEIFAGLAVVTGLLRQGGLLILMMSLLVFAGALTAAWVRGLDVECGCFGGGKGATTIVEALIRDAVLLALGAWVWWRSARP